MDLQVELCNIQKTRNTGSNEECFQLPIERIAVAVGSFRFDTKEAAKLKANWDAAVLAKNVVVLYNAYEVTPNNTDAILYESGNFSVETEPAVKKLQYESYLGFCSHRALKSYKNSGYTQLFIFYKGGGIAMVEKEGKIKGQDMTSFRVGIRSEASADKPPTTPVDITFRDYEELEDFFYIPKPTWGVEDIKQIFDVTLELVETTPDHVKFKALVGCSGGTLDTLVLANIVVKDANGVVLSGALVPADSSGVYQYTLAGVTTGHTIALNGIIDDPTGYYEQLAPITIP